jgi:AsmA protein
VVLNDVSVEHLLCQAVALTNRESLTASFPENTRFSRLDADIQLADGSARLAPLRAELPQLAITGTGTYQLLDRDFKATLKARLSPELETLDPACRVSKRLTAIDWPVNCAGNAGGSPGDWCKVDTEEIITELGRNEAERKIKKKAGKLLDKLFNSKD